MFNMVKCQALNLGQGNPKHEYRLDDKWIEQPCREGPGSVG